LESVGLRASGGLGSGAAKGDAVGVTVWYEQLREQYRPARLEVLLIGESRPTPGPGSAGSSMPQRSASTICTAGSPRACTATLRRLT
jgi:hypothetical protein